MAKKPDPRKKRKAPRRTRMIALEPRMLFDGALGIDLGVKASAALQGETLAATDTTAAPRIQDTSSAASAAGAVTEKSVVEKAAERLGIAPEPPVRNEIVFVDSTIQGHEALIAGLSPNAKVVMLDPTRDAIDQIADYMDGERNVDAIHVLSHGSAGNLILAGQTYSADRLTQEYATDLARIGHAQSADGDILLYGCDVGKGSAGERFIDTLSAITGADIAAWILAAIALGLIIELHLLSALLAGLLVFKLVDVLTPWLRLRALSRDGSRVLAVTLIAGAVIATLIGIGIGLVTLLRDSGESVPLLMQRTMSRFPWERR